MYILRRATYCILLSFILSSCHRIYYLPVNELPYKEIVTDCGAVKIGITTTFGSKMNLRVVSDESVSKNVYKLKLYVDEIKINEFIIYDGNEDVTEIYESINSNHIMYYFSLPKPADKVHKYTITAYEFITYNGVTCDIDSVVFENVRMDRWPVAALDWKELFDY